MYLCLWHLMLIQCGCRFFVVLCSCSCSCSCSCRTTRILVFHISEDGSEMRIRSCYKDIFTFLLRMTQIYISEWVGLPMHDNTLISHFIPASSCPRPQSIHTEHLYQWLCHKPVSDLGCSSVNIGRLLAKKSITVANMFGFIGAQSTQSSLVYKIKVWLEWRQVKWKSHI
jgi:hypothetical protein